MIKSIYKIVAFAGTVAFGIQSVRFMLQPDTVRMLGAEIDEFIIFTLLLLAFVFFGAALFWLNYRWIRNSWRKCWSRLPGERFRDLSDRLELAFKTVSDKDRWYLIRSDSSDSIDYMVEQRDLVHTLRDLGIDAPDVPPLLVYRSMSNIPNEWAQFVFRMWMLSRDKDLKTARRPPTP